MMSRASRDMSRSLAKVPLFSACSKSQLKELSGRMTQKGFRSGSNLMVEGEPGDEFFIILSGECLVIVKMKNDTEKVVATLKGGDYAGEQALLSSKPRNATIRANSDVIALSISRDVFKELIQDDFGITFAKRVAVCAADLDVSETDEQKELAQLQIYDRSKTSIERKWIWYAVASNMLFADLSASQKQAIIDQMFKKEVKENEYLICEGDRGDLFYVIRTGKFEISKKSEGRINVFCAGDCVGELALMYNAPRAASVKCVSDGALVWCLHRNQLRRLIQRTASKESDRNVKFLKKVPLFASLLTSELTAIDAELQKETFKQNDMVIKQGDVGDKFYVIKQGKAKVIKERKDDGIIESKFVGELEEGDYFGERALLKNEKRAASIIAASPHLMVLSLTRDQFNRLLGSLQDLMNRNMDEYKRNLKQMVQARRKTNIQRFKSLEFSELKDLKVIGLLGRGGYGLVKLVRDSLNGKAFALKEVRKDQVLQSNQVKHINQERAVMMQMDSPFLVNLWRTYQDQNKVYFLIDVCLGGDLFTVLRKSHSFKEHVAQFYVACVIEGFEHLHSMDMAYRDLKPENLVLDSRGYAKITDFGFCKVLDETGKTFTLCGTPDYLAPEIIYGRGHGLGVDYWTLGILIYEMLASMPPFCDRDASNIYNKILRAQLTFPAYFSPAAKNLVKELLQKRFTKRLGCTAGGIGSIKKHAWFRGFEWEKLQKQELEAPYVPKVNSDFDLSNFKCKKEMEVPFTKIADHSAFVDF